MDKLIATEWSFWAFCVGLEILVAVMNIVLVRRIGASRGAGKENPVRKCVESEFSVLADAGMRRGQVKTMVSLRLKVALHVLAHNLKFIDLSPSTIAGQFLSTFTHGRQ